LLPLVQHEQHHDKTGDHHQQSKQGHCEMRLYRTTDNFSVFKGVTAHASPDIQQI